MKEYLKCQYCNQIEPKEVWVTQYLTKVCMYCSGSKFEKWPSQDIHDLFTHAKNYDQNDDHYSLVASVFISTALELMLENLLNLIFYLDGNYEEVGYLVYLLLDSYQGRSRRLLLFKKLNGRSFGAEAKDTGNRNFMKHWEDITQKRNVLVHGAEKHQKEVTPKQVATIIDEALDVFFKIHNKNNIESFEYDSYVNEKTVVAKKPSKEDLRKLFRWMNR